MKLRLFFILFTIVFCQFSQNQIFTTSLTYAQVNNSENIENNGSVVSKKKERKMFKPSKVKGFSKLALWVSISLIGGVVTLLILYLRLKKKPLPKPEVIIEKQVEIHHVNGNVEDELSITTLKGQMFEKHIVEKFGYKKEYYELIRDRSDKLYNGIYAKENSNPDLILRYKNENKGWKEDFAVECKYRSGYEKGTKVFIDKTQKIDNYKRFKVDNNMQVFIALGVGGTPDNPNDTFVLPIDIINSEYIDRNELLNFRNKYNYFYFDYLKKSLI